MTLANVRKLFGTDGIRSIAGQAPLDLTTIYGTGLALAHTLRKSTARPRVLLGRDTRESGPWIAATLAEAVALSAHDACVVAMVIAVMTFFLTLGFPRGLSPIRPSR